MAATVSPWATKPGAWALDSEEHEDELLQQQKSDAAVAAAEAAASLTDYPSLAAAAASKPKKKKGQTMPLAEFSTYGSAASKKSEPSKGLTHEDLLILPTGPRQRTAEELDRNRLGGGFKSYGSGRYGSQNSGEDSPNSRWGSSRASDDSRRQGGFSREASRESLPSRADEIDDWSAGKRSPAANGFERRERGAFFNSHSKADESDSWVSNKSPEPRRFGGESGRERRGFSRVGFEGFNGGAADGDRWGRKKEDEGSFGGFNGGAANGDRWGRKKEDEGSLGGFNGGAADGDRWGRKKEDEGSFVNSRPKLVLQPRTLPVSDGPVSGTGLGAGAKPKGANPFGDARPREEVLKEKGKDWKEMEEKLDSMKVKEVEKGDKGEGSFGRKGLGSGSGSGRLNVEEDRTERSWRKSDSADVPSPSDEKDEKDENAAEEN